MRTANAALVFLMITSAVSADVTVFAGNTEIFKGTADSVDIPITIIGGDPVSDMAGALQVEGATITGISFAGSIWESAPGDFITGTDFNGGGDEGDGTIGYTTPGDTVDPNVSLLVADETVAASGTVFTITIDVSSLDPGTYPITLESTPAGSFEIAASGDSPTTTLVAGSLIISLKPVALWRQANFPADFTDPTKEASIWGDLADPDKDSIINLVEFALGLDPNDPTRPPADATDPGAPVVSVVDDGGQLFLTIQYSRRASRPCHEVIVESSGDLEIWDFSGTNIQIVGSPAAIPGSDYELVTQRYATPLTPAAGAGFLRLRVLNTGP
jgi:hypothetical protein